MRTAHRNASKAKRKWIADPASIFKTLNKIQPFNEEELTRLELPIRMSFEALRTGKGEAKDFHDIAAAINVSIIRGAEVDPLCEQTANDAADALMRVWERHERTGKWGFDGPGLLAVEAGISLHEELIRNSTPLQMIEAMNRVKAIRAEAA